jgi:hypothetical protein
MTRWAMLPGIFLSFFLASQHVADIPSLAAMLTPKGHKLILQGSVWHTGKLVTACTMEQLLQKI